MTVNDIAKLTIAELAKNGELLTPQNYEAAYEKIAAKHGLSGGQVQRLNGYLARLNDANRADAIKAAPSTDAQLISFFIARLNALNAQQHIAEQQAFALLVRLLLGILSSHQLAIVRELAAASEAQLAANAANVVGVKNTWVAQISEIKDLIEQVQKDQQRAGLSGDAQADLAALPALVANTGLLAALCEQLAPVMAAALSPSIASEAATRIESTKKELISAPNKLAERSMAAVLLELVKARIDLDRAEISSSHRVLDELLGAVSERVERILGLATTSEEKISKIRQEISQIQGDSPEVQMIKARLLSIVESLEAEVGALRDQSIADVQNLGELQQKVNGLQQEIDKLKEESQQDFLTQLYNKRYLEEQLAAAEGGFCNYHINYSVVFFDIDHFKKINDTYGHTAGDAILAGIGAIVMQHARKLDTAGRWGGEEFMLVMPHTDSQQAERVAQAIREQVAAHKFIYKNKQIPVRISGGVAQRCDCTSAQELIERADALLYEAKAEGRDKIKA